MLTAREFIEIIDFLDGCAQHFIGGSGQVETVLDSERLRAMFFRQGSSTVLAEADGLSASAQDPMCRVTEGGAGEIPEPAKALAADVLMTAIQFACGRPWLKKGASGWGHGYPLLIPGDLFGVGDDRRFFHYLVGLVDALGSIAVQAAIQILPIGEGVPFGQVENSGPLLMAMAATR